MLTRAALVTVTALLALATSAAAATITVTQTADSSGGTCTPTSCSLRQAVAAAADGDTVTLPASTTPYALTQGQLVLSKGITITGAGPSATVIAAQDPDRVLEITGTDAPTTLQHLTITGGASTAGAGGGIYDADGGALNIDDVTLSNNSITPAGAGSEQGGGAIASAVPLTITDSTLTSNTATIAQSQGHSGGGAILQLTGTLTVRDSTLSLDTTTITVPSGAPADANGGGAIHNEGSALDVSGSLLLDNDAHINATGSPPGPDGGGAIYQGAGSLLLDSTNVRNNTTEAPGSAASGGGGVLDDGHDSSYLNSEIEANTATTSAAADHSDGGGGVLFKNNPGGVAIASDTIESNFAGLADGGGVNTVGAGAVQITDTIVGNNQAGGTYHLNECQGTLVDRGYNLGGDPGTNSCAFTAVGDRLSFPSTLVAPVAAHALPVGAAVGAGLRYPFVNAGNPTGCTDLAGNLLTTDGRGQPRPQGPRCDIGAYEVQAAPGLSSAGATVSGSSVTLSAQVADGGLLPVNASFQYTPPGVLPTGCDVDGAVSFLATPFTSTQTVPGFTTQTLTATVAGLAPGTYQYDLLASSTDSCAVGASGTFTITSTGIGVKDPPLVGAPATVVSGRARSITRTSAVLVALVNPQGSATRATFQFGTDAADYAQTTTAQVVGDGADPVTVTQPISGLTPGNTYHYVIVATNLFGTVTSTDVTFTTPRKVTPRQLTARIVHTHAHELVVHGRLGLPAGVRAATGCRGQVTVALARAGHTLATAHVKLSRSCAYSADITQRARQTAVTVSARFTGNSALKPRSAPRLQARL